MCVFLCVFRAFLVCVLCPVVFVFLVSEPPPLLQPLPLSYLPLFCVRLLTHTLYFPCVPFIPVPLPLCCPFCPSYLRPWAFRSPYACFQSRCPRLPCAIPPFPRRLFLFFLLRSRVFLPLFSALFLSFVSHLEKSSPLKSCVISSVKYMFYSIFLVCLGKFS